MNGTIEAVRFKSKNTPVSYNNRWMYYNINDGYFWENPKMRAGQCVTAEFVSKNEDWFEIKYLEEEEVMKKKQEGYKVQVFVAHGYYEYTVKSMEKALAHAQAIMTTGVYRSSSTEDEVEFHKAYKVKVKGEGLKSEYVDTFKRT